MQDMIETEGNNKIRKNTERIVKNQKSLELAFWEIGELLIDNKTLIDEEKTGYKTFEQYFTEQEFSFTIKHAWKIMKAVKNCKDSRIYASQLGLTKLFNIAYVPDPEIRDTIIKKAVKENMSVTEIKQEVKELRMSKAGKPLDYMKNLDKETREEEYNLKINRDYQALKGQLENIVRSKKLLIIGYEDFIDSVSKRKKDHPALEAAKSDLLALK